MPAGLRYLVALCKDLNRRFDAYDAKLLRLERIQAATMGGAAGVMTRMGGPGAGEQDYYPGEAEESGPGSASESNYEHMYNPATTAAIAAGYRTDGVLGAVDAGRAASAPDYGFGSSADRYAAPTNAGMMGAPGSPEAPVRQRDDDFADADLSDLLTE